MNRVGLAKKCFNIPLSDSRDFDSIQAFNEYQELRFFYVKDVQKCKLVPCFLKNMLYYSNGGLTPISRMSHAYVMYQCYVASLQVPDLLVTASYVYVITFIQKSHLIYNNDAQYMTSEELSGDHSHTENELLRGFKVQVFFTEKLKHFLLFQSSCFFFYFNTSSQLHICSYV